MRPAGRTVRRVAGSGAAATGLMSLSFLAHPHLAPPPKVVAFDVARKAGVEPDELPAPARTMYWALAHLGFGLTLAAVRAALHGPRRGAAYGLGVWLVMYGATLPRLRLYPAPERDDRVRAVAGFAAHLAFGSALDRARSALG
jgi:hypothetical protein